MHLQVRALGLVCLLLSCGFSATDHWFFESRGRCSSWSVYLVGQSAPKLTLRSMTPIPATDEHVQGTQSKGYFGLLHWLRSTGHLICLKVALSQDFQHRLQILHLLRLVHIVLRDLCSQQLSPVLCCVVHVSSSSLLMFNRWLGT
jgi:hypothetical protein